MSEQSKMLNLFFALLLMYTAFSSAAEKSTGVIAYSVTYPNNTNKIFIIHADGSGKREISGLAGRPLSPTWSPNAAKIAYYNHLSDQKWALFVMDSSGNNNQQLSGYENTLDWSPSWSADGNKILFTRSYTSPVWRSEIWSINANGSNAARIGNMDGQGADYSPDFTKIVYFNYLENGGDIWKMNPDGSGVQKMTEHSAEDWWPNWSPDGSKIVFQSKRDGNFEIYSMNADGSNQTRLTNNSSDDEEPRWSPDGSRLVFSSNRDGNYEIYTMNADGSNQQKITETAGQAINPDWLPVTADQPYLGLTPPDSVPVRFGSSAYQANSEWWWHGAPTFSPDGREMYFTKYKVISESVQGTEIWFTKYENNQWTAPAKAPFSSYLYHDNNPCFVGNDTLFIHSQRSNNAFIYRMVRNANGIWSTPAAVNLQITSGMMSGLQFSVARSGNIYAEMDNTQGTNGDIYLWKRLSNGQYAAPVLVPGIGYSGPDIFPFIDPNERYLIFASDRPGGFCTNNFRFELYISYRHADNSWSIPLNMGQSINITGAAFPAVSPDGKYLFFNTLKAGDLGYSAYWVKTGNYISPVSIGQNSNSLPSGIELFQNYPNPFNPTTTIKFSVSQKQFAKISIYNVKGDQVAELGSKFYEAGLHSVEFDASGLDSGQYFYRLKAGDVVTAKKMLIIK